MSKKRKNYKDIFIVLLLLLSIIAVGLNLINIPERDATSPKDTQVEKNADSIAIPGYEELVFEADSKKQRISLNNPEENSCYFIITLYLEDGTCLWKSKKIKPGKTSKPIELNEEVKAGVYPNSILHYDCYSMEDKKPLNGAETKLTIRVK